MCVCVCAFYEAYLPCYVEDSCWSHFGVPVTCNALFPWEPTTVLPWDTSRCTRTGMHTFVNCVMAEHSNWFKSMVTNYAYSIHVYTQVGTMPTPTCSLYHTFPLHPHMSSRCLTDFCLPYLQVQGSTLVVMSLAIC